MELPQDKYEYKLTVALQEVEKQVNKQIRLHLAEGEEWLQGVSRLAKGGMWYYTFGNGTLPYIEKKVVATSIVEASYQNKRAWAFLSTLHAKARQNGEILKWRYLVHWKKDVDPLLLLENRLYLNETLIELSCKKEE